MNDCARIEPSNQGINRTFIANINSDTAFNWGFSLLPKGGLTTEADVGWVKMPPCKVNDNAHCINPPDVDKIVWSGFGKKWPAAFE